MGQIVEEKNPFTREFGTVAQTYIERELFKNDIERSFVDEITDDRAYFIVGQRGFGKSSFLRAIKDQINKNKHWYVIELRSNNANLIHEMAAALYSIPALKNRFLELGIDFSFIGIGVSIKKDSTVAITSDEQAIKNMLGVIKDCKKKVLIVIDEISNTPAMRDLCAMFNVCKGDKLPFYMVLDGLIKNTEELESVKDLTFLKRVQKMRVGTLDLLQISGIYQKHLKMESDVERDYAIKLAKASKGYPYVFQLIGYYTWLWKKEDENLFNDIIEYENRLWAEIDSCLSNYVYSAIWTELSPTEQDIVSIMAVFELSKVKDIREKYNEIFEGKRAEMTSSNFSKYRDKLIKNDVLMSSSNTYLEFALPRFDRFVKIYSKIEVE